MAYEYEKLSTVIAEALGKRCPDFDPECLTCRAWAAMDAAEKAFSDDMNKLRADLSNAGAVMVEACAREADAHYAAGDMGNPGHHIRALSTLSPIAAAARVLLADRAALTELAITTMRANRLNDGKRIGYQPALEFGLRALAEQEKADG